VTSARLATRCRVAVGPDPVAGRRAVLGVLMAATVLMAACATHPQHVGDSASAWKQGRLALRVDASAASLARSVSAGFELTGDEHQGELRLVSPLGTLLAEARWQPGSVTLKDGAGTRLFGDLAALSREALGEDVPLAALPDWLAGRPWPGAPSEPLPSGLGFAQAGWSVETGQLVNEGRLEARRDAVPAIHLRIQLDR
jgi:outer membrane lipoprotein LolB